MILQHVREENRRLHKNAKGGDKTRKFNTYCRKLTKTLLKQDQDAATMTKKRKNKSPAGKKRQ